MKAVGITGILPGTAGAWTQCVFNAKDVPPGTTVLIDDRTPDDLCGKLQQKCVDWNTYWRAPDAHGVNLSIEQSLELLRDALGVEVAIDLTMFAPAVDAMKTAAETIPYYEQRREETAAAFELQQLIRKVSP